MSDEPAIVKSEAIGLSDEEFLRQFEDCSYPYAHWTHRAHLRVAYCYVTRFGLEAAIPKVTAGIRAYNRSQGIVDSPTGGYHETMTVAWLASSSNVVLVNCPDDGSRLQMVATSLSKVTSMSEPTMTGRPGSPSRNTIPVAFELKPGGVGSSTV